MNNSFDSETFNFGSNPNEETDNFNYENISGLGESNYENEDLFDDMPPVNNEPSNVESTPVVNNWDINNFSYDLGSDNSLTNIEMPTYGTPAITEPIPTMTVNNYDEPIVEQPTEDATTFNESIEQPAENINVFDNTFGSYNVEPTTFNSTLDANDMNNLQSMEDTSTQMVTEPANEFEQPIEDVNAFNESIEQPVQEQVVEPKEEENLVQEIEESPMLNDTVEENNQIEELQPEPIETSEENQVFDTLSEDTPQFSNNNDVLSSITEGSSEVPTMQTVETMQELKPIEEVSEPVEEVTETPEVAFDTPETTEIPTMQTVETAPEEIINVKEEENPIEMSDTPIEELKKLTEYKDDDIDSTNINNLFDRLSVNVKDASEIFKKNTNLKEKIDTRFEELKSLQNELTNSRKKQMEEIDKYRDEVLYKLTEKKTEIENRLNILKDLQATLEKEKTEFEEYKRKEQANISKVQKEVQSAYDERREELEHIEDVLRKQKDALDEERNQLSLDKIQYESDKNELANNLLKFNQIVNSFTNGIEMKNEE